MLRWKRASSAFHHVQRGLELRGGHLAHAQDLVVQPVLLLVVALDDVVVRLGVHSCAPSFSPRGKAAEGRMGCGGVLARVAVSSDEFQSPSLARPGGFGSPGPAIRGRAFGNAASASWALASPRSLTRTCP